MLLSQAAADPCTAAQPDARPWFSHRCPRDPSLRRLMLELDDNQDEELEEESIDLRLRWRGRSKVLSGACVVKSREAVSPLILIQPLLFKTRYNRRISLG